MWSTFMLGFKVSFKTKFIFGVFMLTTFILFSQPNHLTIKKDGLYGLIDLGGNILLEPKYEKIEFSQTDNCYYVTRDSKIGVYTKDIKTLIPIKYDKVIKSNEQFIAVENGNFQLLNSNGELLTFQDYQNISYKNKGYYRISNGISNGLIDSLGNEIIPMKYDWIEIVANDFFTVAENGLVGLLSRDGKTLIKPTFNSIIPIDTTFFIVQDFSFNWGLINDKLDSLVSFDYTDYQIFDPYVTFILNRKSWLFSLSQQKMIADSSFGDFLPMSRSFIKTYKNGLYGVLDSNGKEIMLPNFHQVDLYENEGFIVRVMDKKGYYNLKGQKVIDVNYDNIFIADIKNHLLIDNDYQYGLFSNRGFSVYPVVADMIKVSERKAKIYDNDKLYIYDFDKNGKLIEKTEVENFNKIQFVRGPIPDTLKQPDLPDKIKLGWYYDFPTKKWGLNDINGEKLIDPSFDYVNSDANTKISIPKLKDVYKIGGLRDIPAIVSCSQMIGIYNHNFEKMVLTPGYYDIRFDDFKNGNKIARIISLYMHQFGYVDLNGKVYKKDIGYIGEFKDGYLRINYKGELKLYPDKVRFPSPEKIKLSYSNFDYRYLMGESGNPRYKWEYCVEGGQWAFLDSNGNVGIPLEYDYVFDFVNDRAIVKKNGLWGIIDKENKLILDFRYDFIEPIDSSGDSLFKISMKNKKFGLIDSSGHVITKCIFNDIGIFSEGLVKVRIGNKWGYADTKGNVVIKAIYDDVNDFKNGFASVKKGRRWTFVDQNGVELCSPRFRKASQFSDGMAKVCIKSKYGYINEDGEMVISDQYIDAYDFKSGYAFVKKNNRYGIINKEGKWVVLPKYNKVGQFEANGCAWVAKRFKYSLIGKDLKKTSKQKFLNHGNFYEGLATVRKNFNYGFVDTNGKLVIKCKYSQVSDFHEGLAAVRNHGRWGYIDHQGNLVIDFKYPNAGDFENGYAKVGRRYNYGLINDSGAFVFQMENKLLERIGTKSILTQNIHETDFKLFGLDNTDSIIFRCDKIGESEENYCIGGTNGSWGLFNEDGINQIDPKYFRLKSAGGGYYKYKVEYVSGIADIQGKILLEPNFEIINYLGNSIFKVEEDNKTGYVTKQGNWLWKPTN